MFKKKKKPDSKKKEVLQCQILTAGWAWAGLSMSRAQRERWARAVNSVPSTGSRLLTASCEDAAFLRTTAPSQYRSCSHICAVTGHCLTRFPGERNTKPTKRLQVYVTAA